IQTCLACLVGRQAARQVRICTKQFIYQTNTLFEFILDSIDLKLQVIKGYSPGDPEFLLKKIGCLLH
ncbi:MAG: hypothetical protein ACM34M_16950, partial [Ignavibacteria bacterium]